MNFVHKSIFILLSVLLPLSCVSSSYKTDLSKSCEIRFKADLPKGEIWECMIDGDNRDYAELAGVNWVNLGNGANCDGEYIFYINPLKKGKVSIRYINRNIMTDEVLKDFIKSYNILRRSGRLVLEEI